MTHEDRTGLGARDDASLATLLKSVPADLLTGRRILVTSAARGLGLAFAKSIVAAGGAVVIAYILGELADTEAAIPPSSTSRPGTA